MLTELAQEQKGVHYYQEVQNVKHNSVITHAHSHIS